MELLLYGNSGGASETEVAQLQFSIAVDEEVLRLQISEVMEKVRNHL